MSKAATHRLFSGCKINLFLHVGSPLPSGMHPIDSLFLPLQEPGDRLDLLLPNPALRGALSAAFFSESGVPLPDIDETRNTLTRAHAWFADLCGFAPQMHVTVHKAVPHGAGLGGGSANAAALLLFLRDLACKQGLILPEEEAFVRQSAAIGADVPFFLLNRSARVRGIGEELAPCPAPFAGHWLLLVCPAVRVHTGKAFTELDRLRAEGLAPGPRKSPAPAMPEAEKEFPEEHWGNDFELPVFGRHPELAALRAELAASGAVLARMSGTGSSLFALYPAENLAADMGKRLASRGVRVYMQPVPER